MRPVRKQGKKVLGRKVSMCKSRGTGKSFGKAEM